MGDDEASAFSICTHLCLVQIIYIYNSYKNSDVSVLFKNNFEQRVLHKGVMSTFSLGVYINAMTIIE